MKKFAILFICTVSLLACNSQETQKKEKFEQLSVLEGLTEMSKEDYNNSKLMLDGNTIKVYDEEGQQLKGMKLMNLMMSGEYIHKAYVDEHNEVKVVIMVKATEEEKKEIEIMMK